MSTGIRRVAEKAGVSLGTVSNAINRPEILAPETLKRVRKAIDELKFIPNASAQTLRAGKTRILGLVVPDISNPFFTDLAKGVNDAALLAGYVVILCNTDEDSEKEDHYIDILAGQNVRGILITPAHETNKRLNEISKRGIGLTLVDRPSIGVDTCSVEVNDAHGGLLALEHLYERGHRKIMCLTGESDIPQVAERERGMREAISRISKADRPTIVTQRIPMMTADSASTVMSEHIAEKSLNFTAVICGNDLVAFGAIRAIRAAGYSIPEDVSVIGYDDIDFAANATVPLTSIAQPKYQLGYAAAELVISECENPEKHAHQKIQFQPHLIVRNSTRSI
jgi:LacI family transcriptional regulator